MAPRATWKGWLKLDELACAVALYTGASTSERVSFHTINRKTGNRVHREFVDAKSGTPVARDDQVKGYEVERGDYVVLEPDEIAAAVPESDKTLAIEAFVPCEEVDTVYLDKPYYLAPTDESAEEAFALLREGMRGKKVAAIARAVLFRRIRSLLIRPHENGLIASTLNFDYEVRTAEEAFDDIGDIEIKGEMLDLAEHIIETKSGTFDPGKFEDRYDAAVSELVKAKIEGRTIEPKKKAKPEKVVDLMDALRKSAGQTAKKKGRTTRKSKKAASSKRISQSRRKAS